MNKFLTETFSLLTVKSSSLFEGLSIFSFKRAFSLNLPECKGCGNENFSLGAVVKIASGCELARDGPGCRHLILFYVKAVFN